MSDNLCWNSLLVKALGNVCFDEGKCTLPLQYCDHHTVHNCRVVHLTNQSTIRVIALHSHKKFMHYLYEKGYIQIFLLNTAKCRHLDITNNFKRSTMLKMKSKVNYTHTFIFRAADWLPIMHPLSSLIGNTFTSANSCNYPISQTFSRST